MESETTSSAPSMLRTASSGTAAEITPVREVDDRAVGAGEPGPLTKKIQEVFYATVKGEVDRYASWLEHA